MTNPNHPYLRIHKVTKTFHSRNKVFEALAPIDLSIQKGEFVSLIGPSGCGKSTLLNIVAGLATTTSGSVMLDGQYVTKPGLDRGVVFQSHALLPWMTVLENILFALDCVMKNKSRKEKEDVARYYLDMVQLSHAIDKMPNEISGGMKQRVGIARTLAINPKMLLLDEPFGALDALTRSYLQDELIEIWEKEKRTVLMVTHDVDEAILLSDKIVVMSHGPRAHIREIFDISIQRPRTKESILDEPQYHHLRKELHRLLAPMKTA